MEFLVWLQFESIPRLANYLCYYLNVCNSFLVFIVFHLIRIIAKICFLQTLFTPKNTVHKPCVTCFVMNFNIRSNLTSNSSFKSNVRSRYIFFPYLSQFKLHNIESLFCRNQFNCPLFSIVITKE